MIGLAKSTDYYRTAPRAKAAEPIPHTQRGYKTRLSGEERDEICAWLDTYEQLSVEEVFYLLFNQGRFIASLSSWWRIARTTNRLMRHKHPVTRAPKPRKPHRQTPTLQATQPGQVACWDISFLPGYYRGRHFALHMVIDLYSRKILKATVARQEDATMAVDMITQVINESPVPLQTLHSDNGAAMTSKKMQTLLDKHEVAMSLIRPGVSNDNAQMESAFHTLKYRPSYPGVFASLQEATNWVENFVGYYNQHHPHSGIAGYTPQSVFDGTWQHVAHEREHTLNAAFRAHPDRFMAPPAVAIPPEEVTLNLINHKKAKHTLPMAAELLAS